MSTAHGSVKHGRSLRRLLAGAAVGVLTAATAQASPGAHKKPGHKHPPAVSSPLEAQIEALRSSLAAEHAARTDMQTRMQAEIDQANAAAKSASEQLEATQSAQADATAAVIQSIPAAVAAEADKLKPKTDGIYFKGVKITPGGFIELAEVYRQHDTANDISTALNTIPYPQTRAGHEQEFLFTPRQSRVSALVEGDPSPGLILSMYGEFDFQGAAQTANSNETNSYNPRIRHLYGAIDWADSGWHVLAGQTFSLVTLDSKGITPRNEIIPLTIDGQYHVGFTWTRQPQVRVVKDLFHHQLWLGVSAENPQTTFSGTVPTGVINTINNGQGYYAGDTGTLATTVNSTGAVTAVSGVAPATQSLNHVPDFVAKAAVEQDIYGHHVHAEVLGIARSFYEQLADYKTNNLTTAAIGAGLTAQVVPGLFDIQASGLSGKGIGRYGSGQLPDATFSTNGHIEPIEETIALVGGTLHATRTLDLWVLGGEEHDDRAAYGAIGYGNPAANNTGCGIEGAAASTCVGNTRLLEELSGGFWQKLYNGPWGYIRLGLQYSYIERNAFSGVGGAPDAHEDMLYTSFRYYPF